MPYASEIGDHSYIAYMEVDDVSAMHAEIGARGSIIRSTPADKPWDIREIAIVNPDGHRILVGQKLARRSVS